jgi:hypothetical protein
VGWGSDTGGATRRERRRGGGGSGMRDSGRRATGGGVAVATVPAGSEDSGGRWGADTCTRARGTVTGSGEFDSNSNFKRI